MVKAKRDKTKKLKNHQKKILLLLVVLLIAGSLLAFAKIRDKNNANTARVPQNNSQVDSNKNGETDLNEPTDAQKNATRDSKIAQQSQVDAASGKKAVTPAITSVSNQEVRAFVPDIIEDGGTCTATYTHGADVISTASSTGISDVSHTTCPPMSLAGPVNIQGDWSVVVTYSSATYYGKSKPSTFKVQ